MSDGEFSFVLVSFISCFCLLCFMKINHTESGLRFNENIMRIMIVTTRKIPQILPKITNRRLSEIRPKFCEGKSIVLDLLLLILVGGKSMVLGCGLHPQM